MIECECGRRFPADGKEYFVHRGECTAYQKTQVQKRPVTLKEAEEILCSVGLIIGRPTRIDSSDSAWVVDYWEKDGKIVLSRTEDGYFHHI